MDEKKIKLLIKRYEDVYLFATKRISTMISEYVLEDMSIEQYALLRKLFFSKSLRSSELADIFYVNKSAITVKVEKLVKRGLVKRNRDPNDRRNVYLSLTEEGVKLYEQLERKIEQFVGNYLSDLTHEELESFLDLYEKITKIIEKRKEKEE
ncbi:MarR family winged helix-turn-helix transcriptional regulator [Bacillus chungangensis]|uniref:MarR family 2-MHQ and catechol resistance regulon transcriptional repressor n=1 Tax=Bacillus chungangensis TaxID=587633 RepID=A0ABT9WUQ1_9BACI|nr:MarR family transcriptional regulator [Bacillus chungangensis]MDQ0176954.1 MarR family 2-MHQ and catechol resistance regulon transcriptional repressor [Bacillus chungangensis]